MAEVLKQLRALLLADPRTSEEIAKLAKMHPVNVRQFRTGHRDLPLKKLEILARILGAQIVVAKRTTKK